MKNLRSSGSGPAHLSGLTSHYSPLCTPFPYQAMLSLTSLLCTYCSPALNTPPLSHPILAYSYLSFTMQPGHPFWVRCFSSVIFILFPHQALVMYTTIIQLSLVFGTNLPLLPSPSKFHEGSNNVRLTTDVFPMPVTGPGSVSLRMNE